MEHPTLRATSHLLVAIQVAIPAAARPPPTAVATARTRHLRTTTIVPRAITIRRPIGATRRRAATTHLRTETTRPPPAAALHRAATQRLVLRAADSAAVRIAVAAVEADSMAVAAVVVVLPTVEAVAALTVAVDITNSNIL